jgi:hypothetical protein
MVSPAFKASMILAFPCMFFSPADDLPGGSDRNAIRRERILRASRRDLKPQCPFRVEAQPRM